MSWKWSCHIITVARNHSGTDGIASQPQHLIRSRWPGSYWPWFALWTNPAVGWWINTNRWRSHNVNEYDYLNKWSQVASEGFHPAPVMQMAPEIRARPSGWWGEQNCTTFYTERGSPLDTLPHYMSISRWWQKAVESLMSINVLVLSPTPRQDCSLADGQDPPPATTTANQFAPGVMIVSETSGSRGHSGLQSKHGRSRRTCLQNLRDNAANERG